MNENSRKKREWVKTVAIIFLTIMLILTFFSQTIMNYSLPEVAAQYIQSGSITAKIRGNGVIESGDPYNVKINGTRKVASVEVRQGDEVTQGQLLCVLTSEDSTELEKAREALDTAQKEFELALLTGDVDSSVMKNAGSTDSLSEYKAEIIRLQNEVEAAEATYEEWKEKEENLSLQITLSSATNVDTSAEEKAVADAKAAMDKASLALTEAKNWQTALTAELNYQISVSGGDSKINSLKEQLKNADYGVACAQTNYNTASLNYDKAQNNLTVKQSSDNKDAVLNNLKAQQAQVQIDMTFAERALKDKQEALADAVKNINDEISLGNKYEAIEKAREEVEKLEKEVSGAEVVAPISGTIMSVNVKSGMETPEDGIVFTMQPEGEGYTMSFTVTNDQAKRLSVGDVAEPVNSWRYDDMQIVLESIRPDTTNPAQNKLLIFSVTGDNVVANQSINVSVGQKSSTYDMIVPNSAIREDNNGKFVLIVESKSSPLGNRYIAQRADVEVIASDDTQSAIRGALNGWEFVITTSNKPVEAGQQVRLPE